jgi:hypothetical protein
MSPLLLPLQMLLLMFAGWVKGHHLDVIEQCIVIMIDVDDSNYPYGTLACFTRPPPDA